MVLFWRIVLGVVRAAGAGFHPLQPRLASCCGMIRGLDSNYNRLEGGSKRASLRYAGVALGGLDGEAVIFEVDDVLV